MKYDNKITGKIGEDAATKFLENKGYKIVKRNFSNKFGEIDIICYDKNILVFVEVKTKKGINFGLPEEMVSKGKLQRVRNMATLFMNGKLLPCRLDIIAIILDFNNEVQSLKHYENVY